MKKIFKFVAVLMTAFAIICCEKPQQDNTQDPENEKPGTEQPGTGEENEEEIEYTYDLEFTLELLSVEAESATVKVKHNGHKDDTWYGFVTTSTNVSYSIEDKVEELMAQGDKIEGLSSGRNNTITLADLQSDTDYTFIVFAITKYGDVYGTYESVRFRTPIKMQVNEAWKVEYTGRQFIGEEEYENTITVTSTDDKPYFMTVVTKERFESTDRETLLKEELKSIKEFIEQYNAYYEVETTFKSWCYNKTAVDAFGLELGYEYVAMAIGASEDGELTGHYAYSEVFKPYEEEMTPEYASWIGDWTFTGSNGVAFNVNIAKEKSNFSYIMTGWEGPEAKRHNVIIDWYPNSNTWMLYSQCIGTFTSAGYGDFDLYFTAGNYDAEGEHVYMTEGLIICIGGEQKDGKVVVGYSENGKSLYTHMRFAGLWSDGVGGITATREFPHFPITVTPGPATLSVNSAVEKPMVERKAVNVYQPKKFQAYDFQRAIIR